MGVDFLGLEHCLSRLIGFGERNAEVGIPRRVAGKGKVCSWILYRRNCFHQSTVPDQQCGTVLCCDHILYSHSQIYRMNLDVPFLFGNSLHGVYTVWIFFKALATQKLISSQVLLFGFFFFLHCLKNFFRSTYENSTLENLKWPEKSICLWKCAETL